MFRESVKKELARIQRLIDLAPPQEEDSGSLHLKFSGQAVYCYEEWYGQRKRKKYLGKLHSEPVNRHVGKRLQRERRKRLLHDEKLLQELLVSFLDYDYLSVARSLPSSYQKAIDRDCYDERYEELRRWAEADYPKNPYPFPEAEIYACDGTRMRSKGECLLYNILLQRGILFRSDCAITIVDQQGQRKQLCPDFLIQCFDGSFIVIEHLGGLTGLKYALDFGEKCYWYLQKGFVLGKNFFVTSDDLHHGTESQMMHDLADKIDRLFFGY